MLPTIMLAAAEITRDLDDLGYTVVTEISESIAMILVDGEVEIMLQWTGIYATTDITAMRWVAMGPLDLDNPWATTRRNVINYVERAMMK